MPHPATFEYGGPEDEEIKDQACGPQVSRELFCFACQLHPSSS